MTDDRTTATPSRWRSVALVGAVALVGLAIGGVVIDAWPFPGVASILVAGGIAVLVGVLAADRPLPAVSPGQVALGGATVAVVLALVQAAQALDLVWGRDRGVDLTEAVLGWIVALVAIVTWFGAADGRPFRRLLADPWGRGKPATRFGISGGLLEVVAWLGLLGLGQIWWIAFTPARGLPDPVPSYGIAAAILAVLLLRPEASPRRASAAVPTGQAVAAVVAAALAVVATVGQVTQILDYLAGAIGREALFGTFDWVFFYAHVIAVAVIAASAVFALVEGLRVRRRAVA